MTWYDGRMPRRPSECRRRDDGPRMFVPYWIGGMFSPSVQGEERVVVKAAVSAVLALLAAVTEAVAVSIAVLLALWLLDMLFGVAKTMRDPKRRFRGDKFGDGILKLFVIVSVPAIIVAMEEAFLRDVWGLHTDGRVGLVVAAILGADLLFSILDSISEFWGVAERIRAVIIRYRDPDDVAVDDDATVVIRPGHGDAEEDP